MTTTATWHTPTDANGNVTSFAYTNANNAELVKTKQTDPSGRPGPLRLRLDGDLVSHTDRNGNGIDTFSYDPLDQLSGAAYGVTGGTSQSSFSATYDLGDSSRRSSTRRRAPTASPTTGSTT